MSQNFEFALVNTPNFEMEAKKVLKPAKLIIDDVSNVKSQETLSSTERMSKDAENAVDHDITTDHDYAMEVSMANKRKDSGSVPTTPSKIPVGKKSKSDNKEAEVSNLAILEAIQSMEKNFNKQLAQLQEQAKQSSCMIASLTKAVQFHAEEVKECTWTRKANS